MNRILGLQKLAVFAPSATTGEEMMMSTASGICPFNQEAEESSPLYVA